MYSVLCRNLFAYMYNLSFRTKNSGHTSAKIQCSNTDEKGYERSKEGRLKCVCVWGGGALHIPHTYVHVTVLKIKLELDVKKLRKYILKV